MSYEFRFLGAMCASAAAVAVTLGIAFAITGGSAWMLAFLPLFMASVVVPTTLILRGWDDTDDSA